MSPSAQPHDLSLSTYRDQEEYLSQPRFDPTSPEFNLREALLAQYDIPLTPPHYRRPSSPSFSLSSISPLHLTPPPKPIPQPPHKSSWPEGLYLSDAARSHNKSMDDVWNIRKNLHNVQEKIHENFQHYDGPPAANRITKLKQAESNFHGQLEQMLLVPNQLGWIDETDLGWHWTNRYWSPGSPTETKVRGRADGGGDAGAGAGAGTDPANRVPVWYERGARAEFLAVRQKSDAEADSAAKARGFHSGGGGNVRPGSQDETKLVSEITRVMYDPVKDQAELKRRYEEMLQLRKMGRWQTVFGTMWRVPPGLGFEKMVEQDEIEERCRRMGIGGKEGVLLPGEVEGVVRIVRGEEDRSMVEEDRWRMEQWERMDRQLEREGEFWDQVDRELWGRWENDSWGRQQREEEEEEERRQRTEGKGKGKEVMVPSHSQLPCNITSYSIAQWRPVEHARESFGSKGFLPP